MVTALNIGTHSHIAFCTAHQDPATMSKAKEDALYELNMRRETWCQVEVNSKLRRPAERRHYDCHLRNTWDFHSPQAKILDQRSAWVAQVHRHHEKRHFQESCKHLSKIILL